MANEIWKRMKGDTNKSYQAFCIYRNLGKDRSLEKVTSSIYFKGESRENVGSKFKAKFNQVMKWSTEKNWINRVAAYDDYLDDQAREDIEGEWREAILLQKKIARTALKKVFNHIDKMNELETSTRDMTNLLKEAANLQRLCFGEATEHVKSENKNEDVVIMLPDNGR